MSEIARLRAEAGELENQIARLETQSRELARSLSEFGHHARRHHDALERIGGRSREIETALRTIAANQALASRERAEAEDALRDVRARLDRIKARLDAASKDWD